MHFRLLGDNFTGLVRNVFLEGDPAKAIRMIVNGLNGDGIGPIAQQVLDGTHRFTGDETSGFGVEEDSNPEYVQQVRWAYAGRVKLRNHKGWFVPRAVVQNLGTRDAQFARDRGATRSRYVGTCEDDVLRDRASYYADEGEVGLVIKGEFGSMGKNPMVIFEPCDPPPSWWEPLRTPGQALQSMIDAEHKLETVGDEAEDPDDEVSVDPVYSRVGGRTAVSEEMAAESLQRAREAKRQDPAFQQFRYDFEIKSYRQKVRTAAGEDYIPLYNEDDVVVGKVPRKPFLNWALGRTTLAHLAPLWKSVSPSGLKMGSDNPHHTDAVLGAYDSDGNDFPFTYDKGWDYDSQAHRWFINTLCRVQREMGGFDAAVLSGGECEHVYGTVGEDILVLPNLNPKYLDGVLRAKAVITQEGGAVCHLAQVAMEQNIPILRVPDAIEKFRVGVSVKVDPKRGRIQADAGIHYGELPRSSI